PGECEVHLEPEHTLSDNVAWNLVRARVDRRLAIVAVACGERGPEAIESIVAGERRERLRERSGRLHHELGQRLLDLGPFDLEHRDFGARLLPVAKPIEKTKIGDRERHQLDLDPRYLIAKARVVDQRLTVFTLGGCERLQLLE